MNEEFPSFSFELKEFVWLRLDSTQAHSRTARGEITFTDQNAFSISSYRILKMIVFGSSKVFFSHDFHF
jgi:hypothetical protein